MISVPTNCLNDGKRANLPDLSVCGKKVDLMIVRTHLVCVLFSYSFCSVVVLIGLVLI